MIIKQDVDLYFTAVGSDVDEASLSAASVDSDAGTM